MADIKTIQEIITNSFQEAEVHVLDPRNDGMHLEAVVISPDFEGLSLLKQHRLVMDALKEYFDDASLHALQLKTYTKNEWEKAHANQD